MNLKEAAHQLGVHYQTAYKWVRTGDLIAVRVGGRYEVSPAAIQRFEAARHAVAGDDRPESSKAAPLGAIDPEDVIEELEALVTDPFVALPAVVALISRRGAAVLGDVCIAAVVDEAGGVMYESVDHPSPAQAAILTGALHLTKSRPAPVGGIAARAMLEQRIIRIPHLPQDWLRRVLRPELVQHLDRCPVHSVLAAPVIVEGATVGVIVFTRDAPNHPYSEQDTSYVQRLVDRAALLFQSAVEIETAWEQRGELVKRLTRSLRSQGRASDGVSHRAVAEVLRATANSESLPVAIFDHAGHIMALNEPGHRMSGYSDEAVVGTTFKRFTHPDDVERERAGFTRLVTGELDYLDILVRRVLADGRVMEMVSHRGAVRDGDATLRLVVSVFRPVRVARDVADVWTLDLVGGD